MLYAPKKPHASSPSTSSDDPFSPVTNSWDVSMSLTPASHVPVRSALCAAAMPGSPSNSN